ncbi:MAG: purine-cytosine permease-like transporter [Isosphaeraceae bacterium]|nr:purine-cytosine permease-like transporter [Isosphaeraceae bacterium]
MATAEPALPPALRAALEAPPWEPKPWQNGVAASYIALFLLIVYYDRLAPQTLAVGGLAPSLLGAAVAGLLCYLLLYYTPAMWGMRTRRPLHVVAASTFGARGATWVPGVLMGLAQIIWFAVALWYPADTGIKGLQALGLIDPKYLAPMTVGGVRVENTLFLAVVFLWSINAALIGTLAFRLAAAVMNTYPVFPALVLGAIVIWAMPGLSDFRAPGVNPVTGEVFRNGGPFALAMMIQLIFGFFATHGAMGADWGAATHDAKGVRLGGLVGVAFGSIILASLALLIVAGGQGRMARSRAEVVEPAIPRAAEHGRVAPSPPRGGSIRDQAAGLSGPAGPPRFPEDEAFTVRGIILRGIGGKLSGAALIVFGLALLGPGCYCPYIIGHRFVAAWPRVPRWAWSLLGAVATWPLVAFGIAGQLEPIFGWLGAAFAPVVGAMTADYVRHRGAWPGPRRGWNLAGMIAWCVGVVVGLLPDLGRLVHLDRLSRAQPAAVFAFAAAFVVDIVLAGIGLEPKPIAAAVPGEPISS